MISHAQMDIKRNIGTFNRLCDDMRGLVPYVKHIKADGTSDEVKQAVEAYKKMVAE